MFEKYNDMTLVSQPHDLANGYKEAAQFVIEQALFQFERDRLMRDIDKALEERDKALFLTLSTQYNELRDRYRHLEGMHA
ncbi:IDEAL domain-containing protein [Anoxybacillus sp. LAT_35]|uniref:IDEAL domain-containing protein n=1 Tax=Anoxybacillus TaxID=150247 RepID=UPI001EDA9A48|nr:MULTISPECIES: IDEAL domain-containing protein [Anoxybacillus]MCG5025324.1 IDEAL domain-containing protein [Anoxybacillus flavithermus]MCG3083683.1 IDEAL domain-containing protein [Anoxybacillus sp. LAT27]MCG6171367.1 IDEAL domain-containing protein [Anoxybacillus sp. LAT_11]MCG6175275.1 IDEAL domain-containing protein [Anoxybacillus sp. LAT_31]MCG6178901.1 IDEAL domain-containing protein [Anoxybacillus sp. LAT_35]